MRPLVASSYTTIEDRKTRIDHVRDVLKEVINAQPTQVHPTERELYLDAIVKDLENRDGAPWTVWPEDVYLLALTATKTLGRNPVGSETLLEPNNLSTLLFHSALPFSQNTTTSKYALTPDSPTALEALKVLANLLVLHAAGRNRFANAGGARAVARALAGKDEDGRDIEYLPGHEANVERLFLLGRLGFLVTMERSRAVGSMVDHEDAVNSLVYYLTSLPCIPANYMALSELLKLSNNIFRFYPFEPNEGTTSMTSRTEHDPWDERLDPVLHPILALFYSVPFDDLAPPLSHMIHALLSIPFIPRLLPTWHSVPEPQSSNTFTPGSMKAFLNKFSNLSTSSSSSSQPRKLSAESLVSARRAKSPSPTSPRASLSSSRRPVVPKASANDATALPNRLAKILTQFFETYLPYPIKPDDPLPRGLVLDESLPPLLLLLTRAATGSEPFRKHLKEILLPSTIDRTPDAGPLEARKGLLGDILRLSGCAGHQQTRDTARELLWTVCDGDPSTLSVEIGYGNAAGILFQKGISGPPPAKIEEIPDGPESSSTGKRVHDGTDRDPITSLRDIDAVNSRILNDMTQEEKEREAERLFVLFNRMEKNPVISMKSDDGSQDGKKVSITDLMRTKLENGDVDQWEKDDSENERLRKEKEDEEDELQAVREIEEYKRRMGRK